MKALITSGWKAQDEVEILQRLSEEVSLVYGPSEGEFSIIRNAFLEPLEDR